MKTKTKEFRVIFHWALLWIITINFLVVFDNTSAFAAEHSPLPNFTSSNCMFEIPLGVVEGEDVECGYLSVLEDRQDPNGSTIELAVVIIKTNSLDPQPDPIFMAQGGPGGSTIETYASLLLTDSRLRNNRDIILFDQRGTLYSKPDLFCEEIDQLIADTLEKDLSQEENKKLEKQAMAQCRNRLIHEGINLSAYNSLENSADIDDLRQALGYEEINLYGVSYGTLLALHTMRKYPDKLRSVILDAVVPPQVNFITESPSSMNRSFERLFETCKISPECNNNFPDLEQKFYDLINKLENNPAQVKMTDLETGNTYNAVIDGESFTSALFQMLYSSSLVPALPRMIFDASVGEFDFFSRIFSIFLFDRTMSYGMYYSVLCAEDADFDPKQHNLESLKPEIAAFEEGDAQLFLDICEIWDVEYLGTDLDKPVLSNVPTLLLSGSFDPITPPDYAATVASSLQNSYEIIFPSGSHGAAFEGDCQDQIILDFLEDPYHKPDSSCTENLIDIQFFTKNNLINVPGLIKILNLEGTTGIEFLIFILCLFFMLSAVLVIPIEWLVKFIRKRSNAKTTQEFPRIDYSDVAESKHQNLSKIREPAFLQLSNLIAILNPIIQMIFTLGLITILSEMVIKNDYRLFFGVPATASSWLILSIIILILGIGMLFASIQVWMNKNWKIWKRVYYNALTICAFVNIYILYQWGIFNSLF